jgi:hypothetical protein
MMIIIDGHNLTDAQARVYREFKDVCDINPGDWFYAIDIFPTSDPSNVADRKTFKSLCALGAFCNEELETGTDKGLLRVRRKEEL